MDKPDHWGDDDNPHSFNSIMLRKADEDDDNIDDADSAPLLEKLDQFITVMSAADPSKSPQEHLFSILHTPRGKRLAEHLNNLTKRKDPPMPQVNIMKLIEVTEQGLMAQVTKRDGESYHQSFARRYETDIDFR